MGTEIATILKTDKEGRELDIKRCGSMVQITQGLGTVSDEPGFIRLTPRDAYQLISVLATWLQQVSNDEVQKLEEAIKQNREMRDTIIYDTVKCARFIQDLKILEVPLRLLGI